MQVHFGTELLLPEWDRAVVCIGTFDGVHLGHQAVIFEAVRKGREEELPVILITFDRHPSAVLNPDRCPKAIASLYENLQQIQRQGVGIAVVLPFNAWLSRMSAERFLREMLIGALRATHVVVGHDFAMGNGREGTTEWLSARIPTTIVAAHCVDGLRVSSSAIRTAVEAGEMEASQRLLGRPFQIDGIVVGGQRLGRTLGFPTLNLARSIDQVMPRDGIYAAWADTGLGRFRAALSIGNRPTVDGQNRTIEAFLIDYPGDSLYGQSVGLHLVRRIRDEVKFSSLEDLKTQMADDVIVARQLLDHDSKVNTTFPA